MSIKWNVKARTCICGKLLGSRGWLTRHKRTCDVWLNSMEFQIMQHTIRAFAPMLAEQIYNSSPLMRQLIKNSRR